jgi:signal transduction histidine kinase
MLTFSRRSELHYVPLDLKELFETTVRLASSDYDLKEDYDIKQVEFVLDIDPELGPVECDKTEIEQVILNLIVNAAQAMAKHPVEGKTPQITLRTRLEGDYARLEVIDNGPGMEEETRRRLFEPFYTTKDVGVGTGLGLSVSYFIIYDQHQGSMQVESAPGEGARFIIRLPRRQAEVA